MGCISPEDPIQLRFDSVGLGFFVSNPLPSDAGAAGPHFEWQGLEGPKYE